MYEWMTMTRKKPKEKRIQCLKVIKIMLAHKCKASKQGQGWAVNYLTYHRNINTMFNFNSCIIIQINIFKNISQMNRNLQPNLYYLNVDFKPNLDVQMIFKIIHHIISFFWELSCWRVSFMILLSTSALVYPMIMKP